MSIESQSGGNLPHQEGKEGNESHEDVTADVHIYVVEDVVTEEGHATPQGFGYSTPLETPRTDVMYHWEGRLHPTADERENPDSRDEYINSGNAHKDLRALAQNFAANYRDRQSSQLQEKEEPSYKLIFEPPEKEVKDLQERKKQGFVEGRTLRALTSAERQEFMEAFRKANREAAKGAK